VGNAPLGGVMAEKTALDRLLEAVREVLRDKCPVDDCGECNQFKPLRAALAAFEKAEREKHD